MAKRTITVSSKTYDALRARAVTGLLETATQTGADDFTFPVSEAVYQRLQKINSEPELAVRELLGLAKD